MHSWSSRKSFADLLARTGRFKALGKYPDRICGRKKTAPPPLDVRPLVRTLHGPRVQAIFLPRAISLRKLWRQDRSFSLVLFTYVRVCPVAALVRPTFQSSTKREWWRFKETGFARTGKVLNCRTEISTIRRRLCFFYFFLFLSLSFFPITRQRRDDFTATRKKFVRRVQTRARMWYAPRARSNDTRCCSYKYYPWFW